MFFKDSITLLSEAAAADLDMEVTASINEANIISKYNQIEELSEQMGYPAANVPVIKIGGEYYTEMQYLAPFMQNNGITSIEAALTCVAESNGLGARDVGIAIESQDAIEDKIAEACKKSRKAGSNMMAKIGKVEDIAQKLKDNGFKVKKKKSNKKKSVKEGKSEECCKECGLPLSECKCNKSKKESAGFRAGTFDNFFSEGADDGKKAEKVCPECGRPMSQCKCAKKETADVTPHQKEPGSDSPEQQVKEFFNF